MNHTTNLNLNLPEYADEADVASLNENMQIIDYAVGDLDDDIAAKVTQPSGGTAGQVLEMGSNGEVKWGEKLPVEDVVEAVEDWLETNMPPQETIVVDRTLSVSGAAADAKVTGDNINRTASIRDSGVVSADLDISDQYGNVIARLEYGHIKTKHFDSSEVVADLEEAKDDLETLSGIVEEKITEPDITGISGQVLGLDDNLNPKWINQSVNDDIAVKESTETGIDLDISDTQGNVILRLSGGHIQTKEFDSSEIIADLETLSETLGEKITEPEILGTSGQVLGLDGNLVPVWTNQNAGNNDTAVKDSTMMGVDLDISDNAGNVILRLSDGNIKTKNFDSAVLAQKVIYPSDFISRLKPNVYRIGKKYFTDFDIKAHKLTGSGTVWVDATASSGGSGTEDNPYNNVNTAISSGAKTIYLKTGTYVLGTHFNDQTDIVGKNVIGIGNVVIDCTSATNGPWRCKNGSAYLENVEIQGGVYAFYAQMTDTDTLYMYKVKLHDTSNNALYVLGGNVYAVECVAYNAAYDGFNYHANGTSLPNIVEVNCVAYDCGDGTRDSDNGSTIHDGESIVRIGGEYYRCHGGVIADKGYDQNTPSYSLNYGVYAHDSTHAILGNDSFKASFWAQYAKMWLYDCMASGSMYDISSTGYAEVFSAGLMSENPFVPSDFMDASSTILRIGGV